MKRLLLASLVFLTPRCESAPIKVHAETYAQCETILVGSRLGEIAEEVVFHYLRVLEDRKVAIYIAEKLEKDGLLDKAWVEKLKALIS